MKTPGARTYILERTRVLITGRPGEPFSGAARLAPTDSEAGSRCSANSRTTLRSTDSGAVLPTSATSEAGPHLQGGEHVRPGLRRPG
jgi:hypothetical protein